MLKDIPQEEKKTTLYFSGCNDAAVFKVLKEENLSPLVFECLNIDPKNRSTFCCLFFVALFPPQVKDYNKMYNHVLKMLDLAQAFSGFEVWDENGVQSILKIQLVRKVQFGTLCH